MNKNKYTYLSVLQEFVPGCGWEDSVKYDHNTPGWRKEAKADLESYRREGIQVRLIERRQLN